MQTPPAKLRVPQAKTLVPATCDDENPRHAELFCVLPSPRQGQPAGQAQASSPLADPTNTANAKSDQRRMGIAIVAWQNCDATWFDLVRSRSLARMASGGS
mmetsp:Transcript_7049/g.14157  ORF Transcript_7049/g.14157 Transcript_7049/m.14157 type:complete len:101 (+) Transcript_7049:193-495(+)